MADPNAKGYAPVPAPRVRVKLREQRTPPVPEEKRFATVPNQLPEMVEPSNKPDSEENPYIFLWLTYTVPGRPGDPPYPKPRKNHDPGSLFPNSFQFTQIEISYGYSLVWGRLALFCV